MDLLALILGSSLAGLTKGGGLGNREHFEWHSAVYLSMNHPTFIAKSISFSFWM